MVRATIFWLFTMCQMAMVDTYFLSVLFSVGNLVISFLSFFFFFSFLLLWRVLLCGPSQTRLHGHTKRIISQEFTPRSRNAGLEINECSALPNNMKLFSKVTVIMYTPTRMCKLSCWVTSSPTLGILVFFLKAKFPSPGDLPHPGIETGFPALQAGSLPSEPPGKPLS